MSSVVVVTPLIIAGWPVITAAVTAAVGTLGFSVLPARAAPEKAAVKVKNREEIDIEDSEVLKEAAGAESPLVVERQGVRATFSRDERGALKLCMEGEGVSKQELRAMGEELMGRVTQQYAYHRIVTELQQRNMTIVDEEVDANRTVKIRVRHL
jgi:hypothetical protein